MGKYKVIRNFRDTKNDGDLVAVGTPEKPNYFECDEKRFKEIQAKGNFLEEVKKEPEKAEKK